MPELPEVERARQTLESALGRRIAAIDDRDSYVCRPHAPGEIAAPAMGMFGTAYMWSLGVLIAGGAANIQRNIIAERGLGLPRDSAKK